MEKRSENNGKRRHRGNNSGGRNRNRRPNNQGNSNRNRNRNRNRNQGRSRRRKAPPKPTLGQKILSILTFGLLGKPKAKTSSNRQKSTKQSKPQPASKASTQSKPKPKKARQKTEVTSGRLYVGNLDYAATEHDLEELFRGVGSVLSAEVVTNSRTQQSKGFAFVEMVSIDEAKRAVEILDDQDFMGRKLIVSGARSDGPREKEESSSAPENDSTSEANEEVEEPSLSESRA